MRTTVGRLPLITVCVLALIVIGLVGRVPVGALAGAGLLAGLWIWTVSRMAGLLRMLARERPVLPPVRPPAAISEPARHTHHAGIHTPRNV